MTIITYNDKLYREALAGTLKTNNPSEKLHDKILHNKTNLPIGYAPIDGNGYHGETQVLNRGEKATLSTNLNVYYLLTNALTGAFVGVFQVSQNRDHYDITVQDNNRLLFEPNDIGFPPLATATTLIPSNSWSTVVGISNKQKGKKDKKDINYIAVREQSWDMSSTSYTLGPQEKKQISVTHETGRVSKTSDLTSVSATVGTSASAGWGPVSASISASLSATSTVSHDVSIQEQVTSFVLHELNNKRDVGLIVYFWKLMDNTTLYKLDSNDNAGEVLANISYNIGPMIPVAYTVTGEAISLLA